MARLDLREFGILTKYQYDIDEALHYRCHLQLEIFRNDKIQHIAHQSNHHEISLQQLNQIRVLRIRLQILHH